MQYLGHTYTKDSIHCFSEIHIEPAALHFYLLRLVINWLISLQPHILLSPTPSSWPKSHPKGGAEPKSEHNQGQIAAKLYYDFWISGWKLFLWIRGYWAAPHRPISPVLASPQDRREGNRDINGLMDRGAYMPGPRSWRDTPPCAEHFAADSFPGGEGGYQSEGELTSGWLTSYQRNQQRAHPLPPAIKLSWQSCSDPKLEHPYIYLKLPQQLISYNPIKHRKFKVWNK